MIRRSRGWLLIALIGLCPGATVGEDGNVLVSAAVSLRDVLQEAWVPFKRGGGRVVLNAGGSGVLLRQILRGAPVDLFISASPRELDELQRADLLVAGSRCTLASNRLVAIFPPESAAVQRFADLAATGSGRLAIGNPKTVPAGRYAREALAHGGLWKDLQDRLVYAGNVRQVVEYVARGDAAAGLVYRTDAVRFGSRVRVGPEAPDGSHPPILYQAALLKDGPNPAAAANLLAVLKSGPAREAFRRHGFLDAP